jgi:hypothetical protein
MLLYAQDFSQGGYYLDLSGDRPRLFQRLRWQGDQDVLYYEVYIQREAEGVYRNFRMEKTEDQMIIVSLPSGKYRFSVLPYNLLGLAGANSEWKEFEVLPAYLPLISKYFPEAFYMDRRTNDRTLDIGGRNILPESEISFKSGMNTLHPFFVDVMGNTRAKLHFDDDKLVPGIYDIYIRNPGGFETVTRGFFVGYKKPIDSIYKASWTPLIPMYGQMKDVFDQKLYILGMTHSFEIISSKRSKFNGGIELSLAGYAMNTATAINKSYDDIWDSWMNAGDMAAWTEVVFNMLFKRQFLQERMAITIRFGFGAGVLGGFGFVEESEVVVSGHGGLSYLLLLHEILYIEAGVDFTHLASWVPSGFIKPRLGICWRF